MGDAAVLGASAEPPGAADVTEGSGTSGTSGPGAVATEGTAPFSDLWALVPAGSLAGPAGRGL